MRYRATITICGALAVASPEAAAATHCAIGEVVYFSCKIQRSTKVVSLCGSAGLLDAASDRFADGWLQYRFGPIGPEHRCEGSFNRWLASEGEKFIGLVRLWPQ